MTQEDRTRNERGQYEAGHEVSKEDILNEMKPYEPYTTRELADKLGAPRRTVYNYLEELADQNRIRKKKPEPRRAIWVKE